MSLLHFLQMLFSHPADKPFHSEIATRIVGNFSDIAIDTVLKALKQDKSERKEAHEDNSVEVVWRQSRRVSHASLALALPFIFALALQVGDADEVH